MSCLKLGSCSIERPRAIAGVPRIEHVAQVAVHVAAKALKMPEAVKDLGGNDQNVLRGHHRHDDAPCRGRVSKTTGSIAAGHAASRTMRAAVRSIYHRKQCPSRNCAAPPSLLPGPRLLAPPVKRRVRWLGIGALLLVLLVGALVWADWYYGLPEGAEAHYVGRQSCIECHQPQHEPWTGSHHDLAMDLATEKTVLGDFNDAELTHHGITSRMFRRDGKFFVNTEGPDGKLADFEIKYVFGVDPLQQYMVEFDRPADMPENEIARVQVLRVSWDTQAKKWFHLDPPDVKEKLAPDDDLHWTGVAQRWNNMCADCHSTNLQKNFDVASGTYHTTFSEIDVSCEACHGPGSLHVQLATAPSLFWDRKRGYALAKLKDAKSNVPQVQACAPCHSRRRVVQAELSGRLQLLRLLRERRCSPRRAITPTGRFSTKSTSTARSCRARCTTRGSAAPTATIRTRSS